MTTSRHIGFTGTQRGMTAAQYAAVGELLLARFPHELQLATPPPAAEPRPGQVDLAGHLPIGRLLAARRLPGCQDEADARADARHPRAVHVDARRTGQQRVGVVRASAVGGVVRQAGTVPVVTAAVADQYALGRDRRGADDAALGELEGSGDGTVEHAHAVTVSQPPRTVTFHHGDCTGADEQAHMIARICGYFIVVHPPTDPKKRAWCTGDFAMTPAPYLERNAAIVRSTLELIATPGETVEQVRSGTWATIRQARRLRRPTTIVWPDGMYTET